MVLARTDRGLPERISTPSKQTLMHGMLPYQIKPTRRRLVAGVHRENSVSKILTIEQAIVYTSTRCYAKHFGDCSDLVLSDIR